MEASASQAQAPDGFRPGVLEHTAAIAQNQPYDSALELAAETDADDFGGSRRNRYLAIGSATVEDLAPDRETGEEPDVVDRVTEAALQKMIIAVGGALITAVMVIVVLSEVWDLDIIANSSGPWANLTSDYVNYGTAALGLIGIALVTAGASVAIGAFGLGTGGGLGGMGGR